eukprot:COSAG01_NODE_1798_length_9184_cov_6.067860_16_plen_74_part_00
MDEQGGRRGEADQAQGVVTQLQGEIAKLGAELKRVTVTMCPGGDTQFLKLQRARLTEPAPPSTDSTLVCRSAA